MMGFVRVLMALVRVLATLVHVLTGFLREGNLQGMYRKKFTNVELFIICKCSDYFSATAVLFFIPKSGYSLNTEHRSLFP